MGYLGSKAASGAYQTIIALMPPHDTYIEPFAGSGCVLSRKAPCPQSYAVDLNAKALESIPDAASLVKVEGDARAFLKHFDYSGAGRVLVYADPPYLHHTRTSRKRYKHELGDAEHAELLQLLRWLPAHVILSGYPSRLYDDALSDWGSCQFQVMTRGGVRTEQLWFNFKPDEVHWATFAGLNFTDRQRIKRKAARWAAKYRQLKAGERLAVLAALLREDARGEAESGVDRT